MSMFRRRLLMMAASQGPAIELPAGWHRIDYLSTDKNKKEYIDTGITGDKNTKVEMDVVPISYPAVGVFIFFDASIDNKRFAIIARRDIFNGDFGGEMKDLGVRCNIGSRYKLVKDGVGNYINDVEYPPNADSDMVTAPIRLSAITGTGNIYQTSLKIYICRMWKSGQLVRDYIPVSDGTQEALYDKVEQTLFFKDGSRSKYYPIEYVFTDIKNKEYFDTGILPTRNTKVEIKVRPKDYPNAGVWCIFGAGEYNQNRFIFTSYSKRFRAEYGTSVLDLGVTIDTNKDYVIVKDGPDNYINGTKLASNTTSEISVPFTLWLCGINSASSAPYITGNYIYYCKIWENGELLRDFIPMSNGKTEALYDQVTKTLFYKQSGPKTLDTDGEAEGGVE